MKENNILPFFICARCTDEMQVCDTVCNKPFKNGLKRAFILFIYDLYDKFLATKPSQESIDEWRPNLNPGHLKEDMTNFVVYGMNCLKTEEMKKSIQVAFGRYKLLT